MNAVCPDRSCAESIRFRIFSMLLVLAAVSGCAPAPQHSESRAFQTASRARSSATHAAPGRPRDTAADQRAVDAAQATPVAGLPTELASAHAAMPEVVMSSGHTSTCRVNVGDIFPDLALESLDGQATSLSASMGERLTIVVFWNGQQPASVEQIRHLQNEFADRFRDDGVSVVTVNVANTPENVRRLLEAIPNDFTNTLDAEGKSFARVATGHLPRTYLLRSDRRLLWFDLEYSRSTERELRNAIHHVLQRYGQQASNSVPSLM